MKLPGQKIAAVVDKVKRRLENPLTQAQKANEKATVETERLRKIQRTADRNSKRRAIYGGETKRCGD